MATSSEPDPYAVLAVAQTASAGEIRRAYLALVARYHPDRHQGNPLEELASARMGQINRAYEVLSDPQRRAAFDRGDGGPGDGAGVPAAGFAAGAGGGNSTPVAVWLLLLPVTIVLGWRFGALLVRGLIGLANELLAAAAVLQGTPVPALLALLALSFVLWSLVRRIRQSRRAKKPSDQRGD